MTLSMFITLKFILVLFLVLTKGTKYFSYNINIILALLLAVFIYEGSYSLAFIIYLFYCLVYNLTSISYESNSLGSKTLRIFIIFPIIVFGYLSYKDKEYQVATLVEIPNVELLSSLLFIFSMMILKFFGDEK